MIRAVSRSFKLAMVFLLVTLSQMTQALEITQVRVDQQIFLPAEGERVTVSFVVSEPSAYEVNIYDGRDWLVRALAGEATESGEQTVQWDGRTDDGALVPPEAYRFTISANNSANEPVTYDLTDATAGIDLAPRNVAWDPEAGTINYTLPEPARINIRVGLKNFGPLLTTVVDWVPRAAGMHSEAWDGKDSSGVIDLSGHPNLEIIVDAFTLSQNTLLVGPPPTTVELIDSLSDQQARAATPLNPSERRMHAHSQQPIEARGDVRIELELVGDFPVDQDGKAVVSGLVPVRLTVAGDDRQRVIERRFEPVFFVDGFFTFENEVGFLPFTWIWDTTKANNGEHFVTGNLRGYEGNFGMATIPVRVDNPMERQ